MLYLEVRGEVLVGLVFVGFVQVVLCQSENQVVSVVGFCRHHSQVLVCSVGLLLQCPSAAVLQFVGVLLWPWDEECVDPEVEHLILEGEKSQKRLVDVRSSEIRELDLTAYNQSKRSQENKVVHLSRSTKFTMSSSKPKPKTTHPKQ